MYAVIKTGGKQYRVKPGDLLVVEKLPGDAGAEVAFDQVLMLGEGDAAEIGAPLVAGAVVKATLVETRKGQKIKVFKKIRRQGYRRTQGHRQFESVLRVTAIAAKGKSETWDGTVDLTPLAVLNARARGLKSVAETTEARAKPAKAAPKTAKPAAKPAKPAAAPAAEAPAPEAASKTKTEAKAKPVKAAAPKAPSRSDAKAKAAPRAAPKAPAPKTARPKGKG
jgi:large subunit ribosomal protein L21